MRLLTWNINGVKTLPKYHPWNTLPTFDAILQNLEADIICFQEMKTSRKLFTKDTATPPSFDAFVSLPLKKTGYSGVATYTRSSTVVPLKAEEGLTGLLQPKPPLSLEDRISSPSVYPPNLLSDTTEDDGEELDFHDLDSEGRAVVLDFGLFVLINTYCPNDGGTPSRAAYKMAYHKLLSARVQGLIAREHREVIVLGDLNACAAVTDHCEGELMVAKGHAEGMEGEDGFWGVGHRRWLRDWVKEDGGTMVDVVRRFWPERKGMYTCWNTKISARETNYGTRIDFILVTPGLVPWIKAADTLPSIKGSDHCPVFVDFHDEITDVDGRTIRLRDALGMGEVPGPGQGTGGVPGQGTGEGQRQGARAPPRLCARFWEEFSGKQTSLAQFFGSGKGKVAPSHNSSPGATTSTSTPTQTPTPTNADTQPERVDMIAPNTTVAAEPHPSHSNPALRTTTMDTSSTSTKRKFVPEPVSTAKKSKKDTKKPGQQSIASFFSKPSTSKSKPTASNSSPTSGSSTAMDAGFDEDEDYKLALQLSQEYEYELSSSSQASSQASSTLTNRDGNGNANGKGIQKDAWTSLLAPTQPPKCRGHGEPAREYTVNKPGANKGKKFFICSRPVGPGYDKGKSERLREHVDPQYKCDYFKWSSDVRREQTVQGKGGKGS